jgi:hypothetical protein
MAPGALKEIGHYGNSPYEWAPQDDVPFPVKGVPSKRRATVAYRCEQCGYLELYAV